MARYDLVTAGGGLAAWLIGILAVFAPPSADAHFILVTPDSWMSQDNSGAPEKIGPCGDEGGGMSTDLVTTFRPGEAITVTINEVIFHPGHYRVALAIDDRSALPPEPAVAPKAGDPCDSAAIQAHPTFPILADDMLPHAQPFAEPQTFTVTLPANVTCTKCTLQVLEFMSSHTAPCFYHHCADISIQPDSSSVTSTTSPAGGTTTTTPTGGCSTARCDIDAVVHGSTCSADTIPGTIRRNLDRASELMERADARSPAMARGLRKKAKHRLHRAAEAAQRAARRRKSKLSAGCATSIKAVTDRLRDALR